VNWPAPKLDAIGRLRVLAAAYPSAGVDEVVLDAPFDEAWAWIMDLERNVPRMDTIVRKVRLRRGSGNEHRMVAWLRWSPVPWPFTVRIERGFCMMEGRARAFLVLMAAEPDGPARTRYAHAEAVPVRRFGFLRGRFQRMVEADLALLSRNVGT
jgi:hypothetical protein